MYDIKWSTVNVNSYKLYILAPENVPSKHLPFPFIKKDV